MRIENDCFTLRKWELGDISSLAEHANKKISHEIFTTDFPHPDCAGNKKLNMGLAKP